MGFYFSFFPLLFIIIILLLLFCLPFLALPSLPTLPLFPSLPAPSSPKDDGHSWYQTNAPRNGSHQCSNFRRGVRQCIKTDLTGTMMVRVRIQSNPRQHRIDLFVATHTSNRASDRSNVSDGACLVPPHRIDPWYPSAAIPTLFLLFLRFIWPGAHVSPTQSLQHCDTDQ